MLSIIVPGIRNYNWQKLYDSVDIPDFEMIFVGPESHACPGKFICDFGSPIRASCIGMEAAVGEYVTWAADDGVFVPGTLAKALSLVRNEKDVVVTKYLEACAEVHPDSYYRLTNAYPRTPHLPNDWWIFNVAVMKKSYYDSLGGWDCQFETCALGHADLAARAQRDGCNVVLIQDAMLDCSHGHADHGPVELAHIQHDAPLYERIYSDSSCLGRTSITNTWRDAPQRWIR